MKVKNILIISLLAVLMLFSGCSLGGDSNQSGIGIGGSEIGSSNSGKGGLDLTFREGNPPKEMYKGVSQNFAFMFSNNQKHDITDLRMRAANYDTSIVEGLSQFENQHGSEVATIPKSTTQGPGLKQIILEGVTINHPTNEYQFKANFDYCYTAKTQYSEQVCVPDKTNICNEEIKANSESNGPLSVKASDFKAIGSDKVRFNLLIKNDLKGEVVDDCFPEYLLESPFSEPVVKIGDKVATCTAVSDYKLVNGQNNIQCEIDRTDSVGSYVSQVTVEFEYKYQQQTPLTIKVTDLESQ